MKLRPVTNEGYKLLHDGSIAFAQMEEAGIRVDTAYLDDTITKVSDKIKGLQTALREDETYSLWRREYGKKANLGSRKQLAHILYDVLGYDCPEKTESGQPSTDEKVLSTFDLPLIKGLLEIEKLKKLRSTYLLGIKRETVDGFVHPFVNLHTVETFRSSEDRPNLQNQIKRDAERAAIIRRCFIPRKGRHLVEVDLSGAEVRVSACYNHDPVLIKYIKDPSTDMHRDTAMQLFLLTKDQVGKKSTRDCAKNQFVFPEFYGSVYFQCAPNIWDSMIKRKFMVEGSDISVKQHLKSKGITRLGECNPKEKPIKGTFEYLVKSVEDDFWNNRFRKYTQWKKDWWNAYLRTGSFSTYTGFTIEGVFKRNDVLNAAIQGSAFHWLLWSIIKMQNWLNKYKMKTRIINEVHDSMLLDVPPSELNDVLDKAHEIMTHDLRKHWKWITVPVEVEAEVSPINSSWHDIEKWYKKDELWVPAKA